MRHFPTTALRIFHQPMDILMVRIKYAFESSAVQCYPLQASLLVADVVQAVGAVMNLKWVQAGKVEVGPYCTAQGQHLECLSMVY